MSTQPSTGLRSAPRNTPSAPPGGHGAARLRAARAYARLPRTDVAEALNMALRTYNKCEAGEKSLDADQRAVVAALCGVPAWFLNSGFPADELESGTPTERLSVLERQMQEVRAVLDHRRPDSGAVNATASGEAGSPPSTDPREEAARAAEEAAAARLAKTSGSSGSTADLPSAARNR